MASRTGGTIIKRKIRKSVQENPSRQCVCCGQVGSKEIEVSGDHFLLCALCFDFSGPYSRSREEFFKYRGSGGASCWLMLGKRHLLDAAPLGSVDEIRERDVPRIKDLRKRPGSFIGGVPFGYASDARGNLVKDDDAQVTVQMIGVYLSRGTSLNGVCRELIKRGRKNKHGKVSWNPSTIRFIAEREGWI